MFEGLEIVYVEAVSGLVDRGREKACTGREKACRGRESVLRPSGCK